MKPLLADGRPDYGSKHWIENQIVIVIKMALHGRPATNVSSNPQPAILRNPSLALSALMNLAKLKGFIVEKRQSLAGKIDLNKLSPADLKATLAGALDQLTPGERAKIIEIAAGSEALESIEIE